jgi:hypothetical protein
MGYIEGDLTPAGRRNLFYGMDSLPYGRESMGAAI